MVAVKMSASTISVLLERPGVIALREDPLTELQPDEVRIRTAFGGICGSDLHYYSHGGFGSVKMTAPMTLGHEVVGTIERVGQGVSGLAIGDAVCINPSQPCGECRYCREKRTRFCENMRFMGSAMRNPPEPGAFSQYIHCRAERAFKLGNKVPIHVGAFAEPLAVALHAVKQIPDIAGKRILIVGFGPVGALCLLAARQAGADTIDVADVASLALAMGKHLKANAVLDLRGNSAIAGDYDAVIECSGNENGLNVALEKATRNATIVQVGLFPANPSSGLNLLTVKELRLVGAFRFDHEFEKAVELIGSGAVDVDPLVTSTFDLKNARQAFEAASDKNTSYKVLIDFSG
ncbi:L-idonate 5-dehydrogenase [Ochrobactrum sp. EDr1-4]|uniref:L-idonate 5-dehydrogenase n=1 Tax=Ochrobactrum sp. EDr1-4 TaxID=3368622 RepID=UPI003BA2478E